MICLSVDYTKKTTIVNFRDIGGVPVTHGQLREKTFFRSGELCNISTHDISFLEDKLHLKKIYDFRRPEEIERRPDSPFGKIKYENINLMSKAGRANPSLKNMTISDNIESQMLDAYSELVLGNSAQTGYHTFLMELVKNPQPIIFHCFAGKDRTGFAAALLLKIAGAASDDIYKDYLKTNEARKEANKEILNAFSDKLSPKKLAGLEVSLNVKQDYLAYAFKLIDQQFGSFNNYLLDALTLPKSYVSTFQDIYVI
ncbi:tyrosine-protein phosphatase [Liquorilactobacillus mali]|uniref:Protein tyrosine serine phosphatase n=1 Tax=Liquorilactobacillus mali KCTC 3596 = DSM 20444 TaxID=1046596 RepID=A0A0R2E7D8_9LACO|nr:tyrosine-protein phosphatase [Liquorilactobacillus mali]KRN11243.1 protein tyrosine serine phosphatase [Liquorilactobacillus mali KCTC 3596 = DSM 20444]